MARLAMCGWESGLAGEIGIPYKFANSGDESIQTSARNGSYCWCSTLYAGGNAGAGAAGQRIIVLPSAPNEIYVRCGIGYFTPSYTGNAPMAFNFLECADGSTPQIGLGYAVANPMSIRVYRGTTEIASGGALPTSGWKCLEARFVIHPTTGVVQVWLDGVLVINFTGNTRSSSANQITALAVGLRKIINGATGGAVTDYMQFDDLAVNDTTGARNAGQIGQGGIVALRPTADTADADFTPSSGSDHYALVDETQADGDTTYLSAVNSGDRDIFELANPATGAVDALMAVCVTRVASGAGRGLAPTLRSGATTAVGSVGYATNTYTAQTQLWESDPNTSAAWTATALNSLQIGITLTN
jgi:hypothetical protein